MIYRRPREEEYEAYEALVPYPLQTTAWMKFREEMGVDVTQLVGFEESQMVSALQVFFHQLPKLPYTIGNYSKGEAPDKVMLKALYELGQEKKAIFIKIEPNYSSPPQSQEELARSKQLMLANGCVEGRAFFTPYTFLVDLTLSEEEMLAKMKPKTRYNIGVAQKYGVTVVEDSTDEGLADYLKLLKLTTKRQQFYAHTEKYQRKMWEHMRGAGIAKLVKAMYQGEVLAAWVLFHHKDTIYYPYGASSRKHRKVMASNLLAWEAIRLGKQLGAKVFDLWGCLGPEPDDKHPWYGFHRFKEGLGGRLTEYVGTFDLIIEPKLYGLYRIADRWRWKWLNLRRKMPFV